MSQELIRLIQEPIIEEKLRALKVEVEKITADAMSLVCNEDTVQAVKGTRSDLNKRFAELEDQRKAVKSAVLGPYNQFEEIYKECVSIPFKQADADLKQKITDVEQEQKQRCEDALRDYFAELCAAHHIDFVPYDRAGVTITLADAKAKTQPPKKLREQLEQFMARIDAEAAMISTMDDAEEIMAEYRQTLDAAKAVGTVQERHRRIEAERAAKVARDEAKAREADAVKKVEAFAPPVVTPEAPKVASVTFTVTDTFDRLKLLKQFLLSNGYKFK